MTTPTLTLLLALTGALPPPPPPRAPAPSAEVAGIRLRQPLAMPECEVTPDGRRYVFDAPEAPCFERDSGPGVRAAHTGTVTLRFPTPPAPARVDRISAYLKDGKPLRLWFYTQGVSSQELDLEALVHALGQPRVLHRAAMATPAGGKMASITARWSLPRDVTVTFLGTNGRSGQGVAIVDTPEGAAAFRGHLKAMSSRRAAP